MQLTRRLFALRQLRKRETQPRAQLLRVGAKLALPRTRASFARMRDSPLIILVLIFD
jgi:hypothetical protein